MGIHRNKRTHLPGVVLFAPADQDKGTAPPRGAGSHFTDFIILNHVAQDKLFNLVTFICQAMLFNKIDLSDPGKGAIAG